MTMFCSFLLTFIAVTLPQPSQANVGGGGDVHVGNIDVSFGVAHDIGGFVEIPARNKGTEQQHGRQNPHGYRIHHLLRPFFNKFRFFG